MLQTLTRSRKWSLIYGGATAAFVLASPLVVVSPGCGAATDQTVCTPDETICTGSCAALYKDPVNCGTCGNVCAHGTVCFDGNCATSCGGGTTQCGQSCVDPNVDRDNCGGCNAACGSGLACVGGTCSSSCGQMQTLCVLDGGVAYCANTQSDNANCGSCESACGNGLVCADGTCSNACASDQTWCVSDAGPPYCAKTQSDNANCGSCGSVCAMGQTCAGGSCSIVCSPGLTQCGTECVDVTTDASNCGACGTACVGTCALSHCVTNLASYVGGGTISALIDVGQPLWASGGALWIATSDTAPTSLSIVEVQGVWGIACATRCYWTDLQFGLGGIQQFGPSLSVSQLVYDDNESTLVAADKANVYWWDQTGGNIQQVSQDGGTPVAMTSGRSNVKALVTDGTNVFWSEPIGGAIYSLPVAAVDSGSVTTVVSGDGPGAIAVDGTNIYWVSSLGYVRQAPKGGGTVTTLVTTTPGLMTIAVNSTDVYFIDASANYLEKVPIGGGAVTKLAAVQQAYWDVLALGTSGVLFIDNGAMYRVTPL